MCNDYEQVLEYERYMAAIQASQIGTPVGQSAADLIQANDIRIGDKGSVLRAAGNGADLVQMRFGWPRTGS
jgi:putative SOS response-associated peptidase YedK